MGRAGGKKKKGGTGGEPAPKIDPDDAEFLKRAHELKEEGNKNFQAKEYAAALANYEQAIKLTPKGHSDLAALHSNRAACLLQIKPVQYDAVIAECSLALEVQSKFGRALLRRARAYEFQGKLQQALVDLEQLLQVEPNSQDGVELLKKVRAALENNESAQQDVQRATNVPTALVSEDGGTPVPSQAGGRGPSLPAKPFVKKKSKAAADRDANLVLDEGESVHRGQASSAAVQGSPAKSSARDGVSPKVRGLEAQERSSEHAQEPAISKTVENRLVRPLKLIYGHDIRLAEMPVNCGFGELRNLVRQKFPSSKAVLVKYKDSEGDHVTITNRAELRLAEHGLAEPPATEPPASVTGTSSHDGSNPKAQEPLEARPGVGLPPLLRLYVVEVPPEQEPPIPEDDSIPEPAVEEIVVEENNASTEEEGKVSNEVVPKVGSKTADTTKVEVKNGKLIKTEDGQVIGEEMEIDDWLFDFAQLFRNHVGIDPDGHVDFHELGMELCSEALESVVTSEDAQPLFEAAASKFQEVAALAFFNWGNVYMCAARKRVPMDDAGDKPAQLKAAYEWAQSHYKLAGEKYEEALKIKPDFYEGVLALGQEKFESAKLQWAAALASGTDLKAWDSSETLELYRTAEEQMRTASEMWEQLEEQQRTSNVEPVKSKKEASKPEVVGKAEGAAESEGGDAEAEAVDQGAAMRSQINLFWGNVLFEHSQVEYRLGLPSWKERLDAAVKKFKTAGASSEDIAGALKNHPFSEPKKEGQGSDSNGQRVTTEASSSKGASSSEGEETIIVETCGDGHTGQAADKAPCAPEISAAAEAAEPVTPLWTDDGDDVQQQQQQETPAPGSQGNSVGANGAQTE